MRKKGLLIICILMATTAISQSPDSLITNLKDVQVMEGTWVGQGWIMGNTGKKMRFQQTEIINSKVNGHVFMIEGLGYAIEDSVVTDRVIHDVVGMISINPTSGNATMLAILEKQGRSEVDLYRLGGEDIFQWSIESPHNGATVRFTDDLTDPNQWHEIGEVSIGKGQWYQFFEMSLTKQQ